MPLLIETDKQDTVDKVVLVYASPRNQIERLVKRDGLSLEEAHKRLASQMPIENKKNTLIILSIMKSRSKRYKKQ